MFPDIVLLVRQIDVERLGGVKPVLRRQPEAVADADALLLGRVGRQHEALGRRHIVIPPGPEPDLRSATALAGALRVVPGDCAPCRDLYAPEQRAPRREQAVLYPP